jgi:hypothetical protein
VTQLVLPLHECAHEPLHATTDPAPTVFVAEPLHSAADPAAAESAPEPLHSAVDPITIGAAPTEISCLCVRV